MKKLMIMAIILSSCQQENLITKNASVLDKNSEEYIAFTDALMSLNNEESIKKRIENPEYYRLAVEKSVINASKKLILASDKSSRIDYSDNQTIIAESLELYSGIE